MEIAGSGWMSPSVLLGVAGLRLCRSAAAHSVAGVLVPRNVRRFRVGISAATGARPEPGSGVDLGVTRLIGGGRFAHWLAGACVLLVPIFLFQGVVLSTDMFQALTWLGLGWVLVRLEQTGDERW